MRDLADELLQAKVKARLFGGDHAPRLGRLVILDRIGSGAMGTVYAAYDPRLDRKVAVKVMHAGGDHARVLREARALGKLAHPNVVAIHDAGEDDGCVYVVMELASGVPLRAWIGTDHGWSAIVRVMREAALGLAAAHREGLVHRDVKPDNILIGSDRTRVVDFGLAAGDGERSGAGTPSYLAPEVLAGEPAGPASDQFSFGVTFHEVLYGRRPHKGASREELRTSAARAADDVASDGKVPGWLAALVKRTLAARPGDRFASFDQIAALLERDRRRRRVALAVIVGALAVGGSVGALAMRAQSSATATASCDGSARRTAAWNDTVAARIRAQLGDAPWGNRAITALASVAAAWEPSFRRVCEATRVRGEQSDRLLELRMRCLDRVLDRFTALTDALATPLDRSARVEVPAAIGQLGAPGACEGLTDPAELALPSDPGRRERAKLVEHELDRAWAAYALGRYGAAKSQIETVERAARTLEAPALHAATLVLAGSVEARIGEPARAREVLERALVASATAGAHELELAVWTRLLRHELFSGDPARTIEWIPFARAAAARAGHDGAELDGIVAEALRESGKLAEARVHTRRALASRDRLRDDQRALIEMNLGSIELASGATAEATAAFTRALELARRSLGDAHPTLAIHLDKLAEAARTRGDLAGALALHEQSLALRTRAFGPEDRAVATALFHRAETLLAAKRLDEAEADLALAETLRSRHFGPRSPRLGELVVTRGDVAAARGQRDRARTLYDRAAALDPRLDLAARRSALEDRR